MTKAFVYGEKSSKEPIIFKYSVAEASAVMADGHEYEVQEDAGQPAEWDNLMLLCRDYQGGGLDLIWAHDNECEGGAIFLGHWNDGVV